MKKIIIGFLALFLNFELYAQNSPVFVNNTSSSNVCDGSAYIVDSTQFQSWEWNYYAADSTALTQVGGNLTGLCAGTYSVNIMDSGFVTSYTFIVGSGSACNNFYAYFSNTTQPTGNQSFDGVIEVSASGGSSPYSYLWSNGDNTSMIVNLNPAYYSVVVTDANGCLFEIGMELVVDSTNAPCNGFYATVSSTNASSPSVCDAIVTISPVGGTAPYTFIENNTTSTNGVLVNMCSGNYYTVVTDNAGCTYTTQYYVGYDIDSTNFPLYAYVYTTNVSGDGVCDGTVYIETNGGTAPYTYYDVNGVATSQYISGLCEGIYSAIVIDADSNTYTLNYFIASPDNVINNGGYDDSTFVTIDTLMNDILENCIIDYLTIDTAYISNVSFVTVDSILVTWTIIDGNGTIEIIEAYNIGGFGIYELILQIFCPQRATEKYLIVREQFNINESFATINEKSVDYNIYPNPFSNLLNIEFETSLPSTVSISDVTGKIVFQNNFQSKLIQINLSELAKGHYLVQIQNDQMNSSQRIVK